jgi:hypothetical protein
VTTRPLALAAMICLAVGAEDGARAEPARVVSRGEIPPAVEAELATREFLCRLDNLGDLLIPEGALTRAELTGEGGLEYIVTLCKLGCAKKTPGATAACDQTLIFVSTKNGYEPLKMPGEILDIRPSADGPAKILSSPTGDNAACPVADLVCNPLYEIRGGTLVNVGIE